MTDRRRLPTLDGRTYSAALPFEPPRDVLYVTVNADDDGPFEIFVRIDDPELHEWMTAVTVLITRLLRAGQPLSVIGADLQEIFGLTTQHIIPGTRRMVPGIVARLGQILAIHEGRRMMLCDDGKAKKPSPD